MDSEADLRKHRTSIYSTCDSSCDQTGVFSPSRSEKACIVFRSMTVTTGTVFSFQSPDGRAAGSAHHRPLRAGSAERRRLVTWRHLNVTEHVNTSSQSYLYHPLWLHSSRGWKPSDLDDPSPTPPPTFFFCRAAIKSVNRIDICMMSECFRNIDCPPLGLFSKLTW